AGRCRETRAGRGFGGGQGAIDASPAHQPRGWAHAGDAVPGRGPTDRRKPLLPHRDGTEIGRDAGTRATPLPVRVTAAELAQCRLAEEDHSGLFQLRDDEPVALEPVIL